MAKLKYLLNINEQGEAFTGDVDLTVKQNGKQATWLVDETGAQIVLDGEGLTASEEQPDWIGAGKITGVTLINGDDKHVLEITGLDIKATKLTAAYDSLGVGGVLNLITDGDDTVTGTKKADFLISGAGDDVLTGKGGSDTFFFQSFEIDEETSKGKPKGEHDIITDFDTKGNDADILFYGQELLNYKPIHDKHDVQLNFDDGSTLVLEDVTKKEFKAYLDNFDQ